MSLNKGQNWGYSAPLPSDGVVVASNKELIEKVTAFKRNGTSLPVFGLLGGDLWRTLGGRRESARLYGQDATTVDVDLGCVLLDGKIYWFCAHMLIGNKFYGRKVFISNAAHYGKSNPTPKAHPGDGKFDMLKIELSMIETLKAFKRLSAGTHIPHPGIKYERLESKQFSFSKKMKVEIDGQNFGKFENLSLRIEKEALRVVV